MRQRHLCIDLLFVRIVVQSVERHLLVLFLFQTILPTGYHKWEAALPPLSEAVLLHGVLQPGVNAFSPSVVRLLFASLQTD